MVGIKQESFFDSEAVMKRLSEAERKQFSKLGAYTRTDARQAIKRAVVKNKAVVRAARRAGTFNASMVEFVPSKPGEAPRYRRPDKAIKRILFGYEPPGDSGFALSGNLVVGYGTLAGRPTPVPGRLERGGEIRTKTGKVVKVAPRPNIVPAFDKNLRRMPAMFRDSL